LIDLFDVTLALKSVFEYSFSPARFASND